jgi:hypothetical protein
MPGQKSQNLAFRQPCWIFKIASEPGTQIIMNAIIQHWTIYITGPTFILKFLLQFLYIGLIIWGERVSQPGHPNWPGLGEIPPWLFFLLKFILHLYGNRAGLPKQDPARLTRDLGWPGWTYKCNYRAGLLKRAERYASVHQNILL